METSSSANVPSWGETESALTEQRHMIRGVLAKERKATARFVELCSDWIYGFVRRQLPYGSELVEDVMQEILFAAWQGLPNFREESSLRSWVLGISRHKVEDYYRKRIREADLPEDDDQPEELAVTPAFERELDSATQQERVQKVLARLPEIYALALIWRYRDEKSTREMAEMTKKTEKAMERLLARARQDFRKRWNNV